MLGTLFSWRFVFFVRLVLVILHDFLGLGLLSMLGALCRRTVVLIILVALVLVFASLRCLCLGLFFILRTPLSGRFIIFVRFLVLMLGTLHDFLGFGLLSVLGALRYRPVILIVLVGLMLASLRGPGLGLLLMLRALFSGRFVFLVRLFLL